MDQFYGMEVINIQVCDSLVAISLRRLIAHSGYDAVCHVCDSGSFDAAKLWIGDGAPAEIPRANVFDGAFRMGAVIDRIAVLAAMQEADIEVDIGAYCLRAAHNVLARDGAEPVKITDTEKRLLLALSRASGAAVSRDDLLETVWGYRADIDTHTLETHIYRLRQKIEADPSEPVIIVTDGAGYCLQG